MFPFIKDEISITPKKRTESSQGQSHLSQKEQKNTIQNEHQESKNISTDTDAKHLQIVEFSETLQKSSPNITLKSSDESDKNTQQLQPESELSQYIGDNKEITQNPEDNAAGEVDESDTEDQDNESKDEGLLYCTYLFNRLLFNINSFFS
jgi:hypothetical protein